MNNNIILKIKSFTRNISESLVNVRLSIETESLDTVMLYMQISEFATRHKYLCILQECIKYNKFELFYSVITMLIKPLTVTEMHRLMSSCLQYCDKYHNLAFIKYMVILKNYDISFRHDICYFAALNNDKLLIVYIVNKVKDAFRKYPWWYESCAQNCIIRALDGASQSNNLHLVEWIVRQAKSDMIDICDKFSDYDKQLIKSYINKLL